MKTTKLISLFAMLFLAVFNINPNSLWSADDDIVWLIKGDNYDPGFLLNNEKYIWLPTDNFNVVRNAETGEFIKKFERKTLHNLKIYTFNGDMNYIQVNDANNKLYYYETDNFTVIDSLEKENKETFGQLIKSKNKDLLFEINKEKINVWDILSKTLIRTMLFPKYEEPNLYSHDLYADIDCVNEKIIVKHSKQFRPQANPNTWYDKVYIAFYDTQTLDSLNTINITGGGFSLSSTCKYFIKIQGNLDLYDYKTMKLLNSYKGENNGTIRSFKFTDDDKYLFITSVNNYIIQIWDIELNKLIKTYDNTIPGDIMAITNNNKFAFCSVGNTFFKLKLNLDPNSIENKNTTFEDIQPYPNPTIGRLEIKYNVQNPNVFQYEITNLAGQFLIRNNLGFKNIGENIETIDVENLPIGQYNLRLYSENEVVNFKFIRGE